MNDEGQVIQEDVTEPSHYAMIPKMAMMDLEPFELVLYCHYKMTASENGKCWKANKTLANETGMSITKMKEARTKLVEKGFINFVYEPDKDGNINKPPVITITNVWAENRKRYAKKQVDPLSPHDTPPHRRASGGSRHKTPPLSPHDTKETVLEVELDKKDTRADAPKPSKSRTKKIRTPKPIRFPDDTYKYNLKHIDAYQALHDTDIRLLITAWYGDSSMSHTLKDVPTVDGKQLIDTHKELDRAGICPPEYAAIIKQTRESKALAWKLAKGERITIRDIQSEITTFKAVKPIAVSGETYGERAIKQGRAMFFGGNERGGSDGS